MIFGIFGNRKQRQTRQLNRDAPVIIEQAEQMFTDNRLAEIAMTVSKHLERAHRMFGRTPIDLQRAHHEYRRLHKEARSKNEQANLTAMTLVIIHLRSELAGADAAPARDAINKFISRYGEDDPDQSSAESQSFAT